MLQRELILKHRIKEQNRGQKHKTYVDEEYEKVRLINIFFIRRLAMIVLKCLRTREANIAARAIGYLYQIYNNTYISLHHSNMPKLETNPHRVQIMRAITWMY